VAGLEQAILKSVFPLLELKFTPVNVQDPGNQQE
jgi:hypothetical protein